MRTFTEAFKRSERSISSFLCTEAARFSWELQPEHYHAIDCRPPMGGHAWWKYSPNFWARFFRMPPPLQATTAPARLTEPGPLAESAAPATPA